MQVIGWDPVKMYHSMLWNLIYAWMAKNNSRTQAEASLRSIKAHKSRPKNSGSPFKAPEGQSLHTSSTCPAAP